MKQQLISAYLPAAIAAVLLLTACGEKAPGSKPAEGPEPDYTIVPGERVGLITAGKSSREEVLTAYGDSARVDSIYLGEGFLEEGVVVYPDNPRNRVEIYWDAAIHPQRPAFIRIRGNGGSDWKTTHGITIGTPMEEVERINGHPFELYGFGWDYGGLVTDWKKGVLDPGLGLGFQLMTGEAIPGEVLGENVLSSDNPTLRQLQPVVAVMELRFAPSSLLPLMQGRWQSLADDGYQIEIEGSRIRHYNGGELTIENEIEADVSCVNNACTISGNQPEGFCFIEKGEFDAQCNLVLVCDGQRMEYTAIGASGQSLVFQKVEGAAVQ